MSKLVHHDTLFSPPLLHSPSGLRIQLNSRGAIQRVDYGDILINLFIGNEIEKGPADLYLRRYTASGVEVVSLFGLYHTISTDSGYFQATGTWKTLHFKVMLVLAESAPAWFWHLEIENKGISTESLDCIYVQDVALAHYWAVRLNEYYTSQYLDHTPLSHPTYGTVIATRQNLPMAGKHPWMITGSQRKTVRFATDATQLYGLDRRSGKPLSALYTGLPRERRQHEHALVALQDRPFSLPPGALEKIGFFVGVRDHHPEATSVHDLEYITQLCTLPEAKAECFIHRPFSPSWTSSIPPVLSLFDTAPLFEAETLTQNDILTFFGTECFEIEQDQKGAFLSFFTQERHHVVLKEKEYRVLRPHGHLLRTGNTLYPEETALTSTVWMGGVFHSLLTQGHVHINRLFSTVHSYLSIFRSHGQRIFIENEAKWYLLDVPSAFEMWPDGCRWLYKHAQGLIEVRSEASERNTFTLSLTILSGKATRCLISHAIAINGDDGTIPIPVCYEERENSIHIRPIPDSDIGRRFPDGEFRITPLGDTVFEQVGGDEMLFLDRQSRHQPFLSLITQCATSMACEISGHLIPPLSSPTDTVTVENTYQHIKNISPVDFFAPSESAIGNDAERLGHILPWWTHNALIHYLHPRGLEQYSGGGWGTRDVCQGPVDLLCTFGAYDSLKKLLYCVFKNQNEDGDWPQWFMFFDRERTIRAPDSHSDIILWPLLALAQYLLATQDTACLNERLPFFHPLGEEEAEWATLWEHVTRALSVIESRTIPGTHLMAYGHGDWNDALQPVNPDFRRCLCSAWTVTLHYQTLCTLEEALRYIGETARADIFSTSAKEVLHDFQRWLIVEQQVAGLVCFHEDGSTEALLHPTDQKTGLHYSLLPMSHAILAGMFTPAQAAQHLACIQKHLLAPDGARLFDGPLKYQGGPTTLFQRAESSSFFGREIGLMYTHAHLRYAESLAYYGDAERCFQALCIINPIGVQTLIPTARLRQANTYHSSSDAVFEDRYQAQTQYEKVREGKVDLEGGWRVYSSGPGIALALVLRVFLGLHIQRKQWVIDPVVPHRLSGLRIKTMLPGWPLEIVYVVKQLGVGPLEIRLNDVPLPFTRCPHPYRLGGVDIPVTAVLVEKKDTEQNQLVITLS